MSVVTRVIFVCAGNICRSPIAEAFMRRLVGARPRLRDLDVGSAGTIAIDGHPPLDETARVMRDHHGLDLTAHRARRFRAGLNADLVLALDRRVEREASAQDSSAAVQLLGDFAGVPGDEVTDPYGGSSEDFRRCAEHVQRLVELAANRLERERQGPAPPDEAGRQE